MRMTQDDATARRIARAANRFVLIACASTIAFAPRAEARRSNSAADVPGAVARALASVSPSSESKFKPALDLAEQNKIDESLKALDALASGANASADDKALAMLASGGVANRAGRLTDAIERFANAAKAGGRLADYAFYFQGVALQAEGKRAPEAKRALERALAGNLPPATQIEIRVRLGDLAASAKNWSEVASRFKPLRARLRGTEYYPDSLYQLIRTGGPSRCKLARELYARYPGFAAAADWGPDLRLNKIDGKAIGCAASPKDLQTRLKRLQWGGESDRAYKEIAAIRAGRVAANATSAKDEVKDDGGDDETVGDYTGDSMLANYLVNEGRVDEAFKLLLAHYEQRRSSAGYLLLLAKAAARAGEYAASIGAYYRVYELRPKSKDAKNALFQAAFMSYQSQDYDGALRKFTEFMKAFARSSLGRDARWHLAWIRYLRGDFAGAYDGLEALERDKPIARARRRRGHRRGAGAPLGDAIAADRILYWKAMCQLRMGKAAEASQSFERLARDPSYGYYGVAAYYRMAGISGAPNAARAEIAALKKGSPEKLSEAELKEAEQKQAEESETAGDVASESIANAAGDDDAASTAPADDAGSLAATAKSAPPANGTPPAPTLIVMRFDRARALAAAGFGDHARRELAEVERRARSVDDRRALMSEYRRLGNWHRASYLGETAFAPQRLRGGLQKERELWEYAYPRAFAPAVASAALQTQVAPELIWSIMRAESQYRQDAYSAVGAMGLMQLMPFTGRKVADLMGAGAQFQTRSLLEPDVNIKLGSRYLQRLSENFKGSVPLVAAAYNAGPHRVQQWLRSFGLLEMDEFIEHIPFMETRNYAKKVVRNVQIYGLLYGNSGRSLKWLAKPVAVTFDGPAPTRETW